MKLKDYLKQFKGLDPETEVGENGKEILLSDEEHKNIYDEGRKDGYMKYQNLNPYEKGSLKFEIYETANSMGMIESDMEDGLLLDK